VWKRVGTSSAPAAEKSGPGHFCEICESVRQDVQFSVDFGAARVVLSECRWRGILSLRDPAALKRDGRATRQVRALNGATLD
jgi:hypothetical protein